MTSIVREWGATFWVQRGGHEDAFRDAAAQLTQETLLDEVPDAVVMGVEITTATPLSWTEVPENYDFLAVLIRYTSAAQDRA